VGSGLAASLAESLRLSGSHFLARRGYASSFCAKSKFSKS
jgi:hypothetical protein